MQIEHWWYTIPLRVRSLFRRSDVERELDEELQFHVEEQTRANIAAGMNSADARTAALRAIGGLERRKEECRETRRVNVLENLVRDVRYALRGLARSPGFAVVAVLTLAIGIGANTAMFTVVDGVLLKPLSYPEADRLLVLQHPRSNTVAPATYLDWKAARTLSRVGAEEWWMPNLTGGDRPERLDAVHITSDMLPLLGVQPLLGRMFLPEEEHAGKSHVLVLRYEIWQNRFAGDPAIIGRTVTLDGDAYTVVGVMPPGFKFTPYWASDAQVAAPLVLDHKITDRKGSSLRAFARLAPGATLESARRELNNVTPAQYRELPGTMALPLKELVVGDVRSVLLILLAAVAFVLLIACANVAHLQLIRAAARERESALRAAIGASRARLIQQSLVESSILSALGAALGLLLAAGGVRLLVRFGAANLPRLEGIQMDGRVFAFTLAVTVVSAIAFGLGPAFTTSGVNVHDKIKEGARSAADGVERRRVRDMLVVSEFALALVLLVSVGLVLKSFVALINVKPGYDAKNVVSMQVSLRGTQHVGPTQREPFFREVLDRVAALPGVESVSAINHLPLHGDNWHMFYGAEGQPAPKPGAEPAALFRVVRPAYFRTMQVPLLAGRDFTAQDQASGAHVVIINEMMARLSFPGGSALGRRVTAGEIANPDWFTVIGIAKTTLAESLSRPAQPEIYFPQLPNTPDSETGPRLLSFLNPASLTLLVRTRGGQSGITSQIEQVVHTLDRDAPVSDIVTMEGAMDEQFSAPKFYLLLLTVFGVAALALAAVGVYGVISYSVARRTREIGLRMALGASRGDSFKLVVRQGVRLAVVGLLAGIVAALVFTQFLGSLLYGVKPTDPVTFGGVVLLLLTVAFVACALPAWRAARVQPITALRSLE